MSGYRAITSSFGALRSAPCALLPAFLLAGLGIFGCGQSAPDVSSQVELGKTYLALGDTSAAKMEFQRILSQDSHNCSGLWGSTLADIQSLLDLSNLAESLVRGNSENLRALLEEIVSQGEEINSRNCRLELSNFPLRLGAASAPILEIDLGESWDGLDGKHLANIFGLLLGFFDFITAHSLKADLDDLLGMTSLPNQNSNPVWMFRPLAQVFADNPEFLAADPKNWDRIKLVPGELARSLEGIAKVINTLQDKNRVKNPGSSEIFSVSDPDKDGLDAGDEVVIGVKHLRLLDWESDGPVRIKLTDEFTRDFIREAARGLEKSAEAFSQDKNFSLADFNPVLSLLGITELPKSLAARPSAYFQDPQPLRELVPYWVQVSPGKYEFLIEGETRTETGDADGQVIFDSDSDHFPESINFGGQAVSGLRIPRDGVGPSVTIPVGISFYYLALPDPSLGGLLQVKTEGSDYEPADSFQLNQILNQLLSSWYSRSGAEAYYETDQPVLKPQIRNYIQKLTADVAGSTQTILTDFGISDIVHSGDQVYIKVNLGGGIPKAPASYTDPLVVEGVIRAVQEVGGIPHVCEANMRTYTMNDDVLRKRGYDVILARTGADFVNLSDLPRVEFHPYDGTIPFDVPAPLRDPNNKIISVAQPKHHWECGVSLSEKNMYGAISERKKSIFHRKFNQIDPVVAAAARAMKPDISIIGGRAVCGELGPHLCVPIRLNYLIVSNDMLAADEQGSMLLGYPFEAVKYAQINLRGQGITFSWVQGTEQFPPELLKRVKEFAMTPEEVKFWKKLLFSQYFVPHWVQNQIMPHLEFFFVLANELFYIPRGDQIDWSL
ncbi:MAG: DUF362 domain-containing protein [Proteobacteria bacterium]|nr:DUF362 domain-containing protein [Pseudomonadota bacterium]